MPQKITKQIEVNNQKSIITITKTNQIQLNGKSFYNVNVRGFEGCKYKSDYSGHILNQDLLTIAESDFEQWALFHNELSDEENLLMSNGYSI